MQEPVTGSQPSGTNGRMCVHLVARLLTRQASWLALFGPAHVFASMLLGQWGKGGRKAQGRWWRGVYIRRGRQRVLDRL